MNPNLETAVNLGWTASKNETTFGIGCKVILKCWSHEFVFLYLLGTCRIGSESLKNFQAKNLWNEMNKYREIFLEFFHFLKLKFWFLWKLRIFVKLIILFFGLDFLKFSEPLCFKMHVDFPGKKFLYYIHMLISRIFIFSLLWKRMPSFVLRSITVLKLDLVINISSVMVSYSNFSFSEEWTSGSSLGFFLPRKL